MSETGEAELQGWRSDQFALAAALAAVASPISFMLFGWLIGAGVAALAAALCVIVFLLARLERTEAAQAAHAAENSLDAERGAKARFLSVLSHDLRQPIHALTLYTAALQKRVETDEARGILDKIDRAARSSAELISRIDAYARFVAKPLEPDIQPGPLQPILDEVSKSYPSVTAPKTDLQVRTDAKLLRVILDRLAENAERYGGGGRIEAREDGAEAVISVVSTGASIAAEDHDRIFEEFVRLDGARQAEGLGLGLPVAQRIAKALGADVQIDPAPEHGVRFTVRAPIAR